MVISTAKIGVAQSNHFANERATLRTYGLLFDYQSKPNNLSVTVKSLSEIRQHSQIRIIHRQLSKIYNAAWCREVEGAVPISSPEEEEEKFPESGRRDSCAEKSTLKEQWASRKQPAEMTPQEGSLGNKYPSLTLFLPTSCRPAQLKR